MLENSQTAVQRLHDRALAYQHLGYSVIPLRGLKDAQTPKAPAIAWEAYQRRRAGASELHGWFIQHQYAALGIVTGPVARLVVLDFDDLTLFNNFAQQYPDLAATHRVRTKRGLHLYFHMPHHVTTRTRKGQGVDWLYEGCYVVAPPSHINGHEYVIEQGGRVHLLTLRELRAIETYLAAHHTPACLPTPELALKIDTPISDLDIQGLYQHLTGQGSRNEALFQAAISARDHGWTATQTIAVLADLHARNQQGRWERPEHRHREALATIHSSFSRPARPRQVVQPSSTGLPVSIVEILYKRKATFAVRVLSALQAAGITSGHTFTEAQARQLLKGQIGSHSLRLTLTLRIENRFVLQRSKTPLEPLTSNAVAIDHGHSPTSQCNDVCVQKSKLIQRGRKTYIYTMPSDRELAAILNAKLTRRTANFTAEEVQTAPQTRLASYEQFLKHRPGQYSSRWLAERLGVCKRTKCTYDKAIKNLVKTPQYNEIPLSWRTLNEIPPEKYLEGGVFLLDQQGKKYPAKVEIARRLLGKRHRISLLAQTWNHYQIGHVIPVIPYSSHISQSLKQPNLISPTSDLTEQYPVQLGLRGEEFPVTPSPPGTIPVHRPSKPGTIPTKVPKRRRNYARRFRDSRLEGQAQAIYTILQQLQPKTISLLRVRQLVDQHGVARIQEVIARIKKRNNIRDFIRLLVSILKSEGREGIGKSI